MESNHLQGGNCVWGPTSERPRLPLPPQLNSEIAIFPEEQWNLLLERLRQLQGDTNSDGARALLGEARRLYQTSPGSRALYRLMEFEWTLQDCLQGLIRFDHPLYGTEYSISNGAYGAEARASWMMIPWDHPFDGNGYNSAFPVPNAFSVQNGPGQRNSFLSSSRGGGSYAATQYSSFAIGLEQQSVEDRLNRAIHYYRLLGRIPSNGANGDEAWAVWSPVLGHFFDGNEYNSVLHEAMAFSYGNSPGQTNLFPSSSRRGGGYAAALHSLASSNEDISITIDNIIDGERTDYGREAAGNANGLNHRRGGGYMQEGTGGWATPWVLSLMGIFVGAANLCWEGYSVIKGAFGPKWAPYAYGAVWVAVGMLGAGAFAAVVNKSTKPEVFTKYAFLVLITIAVALPGFVWSSMIFG